MLFYGIKDTSQKIKKVIFKFYLLQYRIDEGETHLYERLVEKEKEHFKETQELCLENEEMRKVIAQNRWLILAADTIRHPVIMSKKLIHVITGREK